MKNNPGQSGNLQIATAIILVQGRVQGVSFRRFAVECANKTRVHGCVRNLSDGRSVEIIIQGSASSLDNFLRPIEKGPPGALVENIKVEQIETLRIYKDFDIR